MSGYPNQPSQGPSPPHARSAPSEDDYYTEDSHLGVLAVSQTQSRPRASASGRRDVPPPSASCPTLPHASLEVRPRQITSGPPSGRTNYQHSSQTAYQRTHSQSANGPSHPHDHDRLRLQHDYAHNFNALSAPPTRPPAASRKVITEVSGSVQALNNYYQDKRISTSYIAYSNAVPVRGNQFIVSVTREFRRPLRILVLIHSRST
ncbi:hypothetical protein EXIGLDRAFT_717825 [Exidia glandulosa HHB12029]|uniref:Uncharacterized protein n=1 Tax=Exidia glandulosa HHB12029 TaxID=1314781 RepID=A0A165I3W3_EXIGL|nr:hypothetical protein EXIGLDRAFT_717825 [Exidia glandulosa HHB12029]